MSSVFITNIEQTQQKDAFPKVILLNIYTLHKKKSNYYFESFFQQPLTSTQISDFVTNFFNESLGLIWEKVVGPRPNSMSRQSESPP